MCVCKDLSPGFHLCPRDGIYLFNTSTDPNTTVSGKPSPCGWYYNLRNCFNSQYHILELKTFCNRRVIPGSEKIHAEKGFSRSKRKYLRSTKLLAWLETQPTHRGKEVQKVSMHERGEKKRNRQRESGWAEKVSLSTSRSCTLTLLYAFSQRTLDGEQGGGPSSKKLSKIKQKDQQMMADMNQYQN